MAKQVKEEHPNVKYIEGNIISEEARKARERYPSTIELTPKEEPPLFRTDINDVIKGVKQLKKPLEEVRGEAEEGIGKVIKFTPPPQAEKAEGENKYLYHNSSLRNLESIKEEGLKVDYAGEYPHGIKDIPDNKKRIYFAEDQTRALEFGGRSEKIPELSSLLLRVKKSDLSGDIYKTDLSGGETWYFGDVIDPSKLEVKINGKWKPLTNKPLPNPSRPPEVGGQPGKPQPTEAVTEEATEPIKETPKGPTANIGTVRLNKGGVKPFTSWRTIKKGPKKGQIALTLTNGKTVTVKEEQIRAWPKENKIEETEKEAIQDFGEKIGGARKDYYAEFADRMKDAQNVDIVSEPLSKSWPEPDYGKLIEGGVDSWIISFVRSAREEIPTKPQKSWKLDRWVAQVKMLRDFSNDLFNGKITKKQLTDKLEEKEFATFKNVIGARTDLYEIVGHEKSLKGLRIVSGRYSMYEGIKHDPPKIIWSIERVGKKSALSNWPRIIATGETREDVIRNFKNKYGTLETPQKSIAVKFDIYSKGAEKSVWIGKKIGRNYIDLEHFDSAKEAREYLKTNQTALEEKLTQYKTIPNERRIVNRERIGKDHRDGKDVTPEMFTEGFGFRGVEFGNWVNNRERQDNLNRAYDALMDLSLILNIPSKAISLNSELGLAFGARGIGGEHAPSAHYEPMKVVINLTRKNGPGTLAHEWWHALDNYFSRKRGQKDKYISEKPESLKEDITRKEILDAYKKINDVIDQTGLQKRSSELDKRRTKDYWGTGIEMTARAFENYVIEKLAQTDSINDYLANIVTSQNYGTELLTGLLDGKTVQDIYPYLFDSEIEK
ncbi:MAG: LPD5 domain-containing protein, partial [Atribacterota bacterium]|nr:LPD5 domain-containing protein [Atribacterota bacterium]